jgi:RHS repeat-associated protein
VDQPGDEPERACEHVRPGLRRPATDDQRRRGGGFLDKAGHALVIAPKREELVSPGGLTDYLFTGQKYEEQLGLYWYGSRWYDPTLGRFIQPDVIIPRPGNPQSWDRYAYVLNTPTNYTDPTGFTPMCGYKYSDPTCKGEQPSILGLDQMASLYGVTFSGDWSNRIRDRAVALLAVENMGKKFAVTLGGTAADAFKAVYKYMNFVWMDITCKIQGHTCYGYTKDSHTTQFYSKYLNAEGNEISTPPLTKSLVTHELGHAFNQRLNSAPYYALADRPDLLVRPDGFHQEEVSYTWQLSDSLDPSEIFADMFLGWVYSSWGSDRLGPVRAEFMVKMDEWIIQAAQQ